MPCECVASCEETRISGEEMRKEEAVFTKSSREHRRLPGSIGGPRQWVLHTISAICGSRACSLERVNPHSLLLSPGTGSPQGIAWSNPNISCHPRDGQPPTWLGKCKDEDGRFGEETEPKCPWLMKDRRIRSYCYTLPQSLDSNRAFTSGKHSFKAFILIIFPNSIFYFEGISNLGKFSWEQHKILPRFTDVNILFNLIFNLFAQQFLHSLPSLCPRESNLHRHGYIRYICIAIRHHDQGKLQKGLFGCRFWREKKSPSLAWWGNMAVGRHSGPRSKLRI